MQDVCCHKLPGNDSTWRYLEKEMLWRCCFSGISSYVLLKAMDGWIMKCGPTWVCLSTCCWHLLTVSEFAVTVRWQLWKHVEIIEIMWKCKALQGALCTARQIPQLHKVKALTMCLGKCQWMSMVWLRGFLTTSPNFLVTNIGQWPTAHWPPLQTVFYSPFLWCSQAQVSEYRSISSRKIANTWHMLRTKQAKCS